MSEFEGITIIKGNFAAAYAARAARVQVVTAYPITPQTLIVEEISRLVDADKMVSNCEFGRVLIEIKGRFIGPKISLIMPITL